MAKVSGEGTEEEMKKREGKKVGVEGAVRQEREGAERAAGAEGGHLLVQHRKREVLTAAGAVAHAAAREEARNVLHSMMRELTLAEQRESGQQL